ETESDGESEQEETREEEKESFDPIPRTPEDSENDGNGEEDQGMESIFTTGSSSVTPIPSPKSTMTPSIIMTSTIASQPPIPPTPIPSDIFQTLLTFASVFRFEDRVKSLEVNFSEFIRTNQSPEAVSNISGIVHQYMHQEMTEAVREAMQIQTGRLQDFLQKENDEFLRTIDDNMKKIIKEQVKNQVKAQVIRILPRIKEHVNAQLEAKVLTRSSHSLRTSYVVAADLSEMELKKILIDKMEGNKSIQRSDEQQNLYRALVEAYEADKTILDSYEESTILKRRRKDDDDQEGPSAGSDRGSKRRREASTLSEPATRIADKSTTRTQSRQMSASESGFAEEPVQTTCQMDEPSHSVFETEKLSNLTVEERFAFNVSLRMFSRSIVIQRRVEDLQLGLKSYQKRVNLRNLDTYRSDLKQREADETLNDVRNALDDRLKEIRMQYLLTTIWRKGDKDRAAAMIQAIDKMLKTRRIMRSLERFVGGIYEGDFQMLQRTI
nr:hypothetical protein [Tanacetum cinerariifolium]